MTKREFYTAIAENETLTAEIRDMAKDLIDQLDYLLARRNADASEKKAAENAPIIKAITELLTAKGAMVSSEIGTELGLTTSKVGAVCKKMVESGTLTATDEKVKGGRTVKKWKLAE